MTAAPILCRSLHHGCFGVGSAVGAAMAGYIFDVTGSYRVAFIVGVVVSVVGLILTALLKPPISKHNMENINC